MLQCPVCHRKDTTEPIDGKRSKYYPFCSDRCKLVDLGAWLDSKYMIASNMASQDPDVNDEGYD
ncbi:MAG: DNA gyrase inhibitor YacG [Phycisphaeraceae bacterium]|nr:DNA gyrase inhibitor YacG [Phycisphaeraceae bacterium]